MKKVKLVLVTFVVLLFLSGFSWAKDKNAYIYCNLMGPNSGTFTDLYSYDTGDNGIVRPLSLETGDPDDVWGLVYPKKISASSTLTVRYWEKTKTLEIVMEVMTTLKVKGVNGEFSTPKVRLMSIAKGFAEVGTGKVVATLKDQNDINNIIVEASCSLR